VLENGIEVRVPNVGERGQIIAVVDEVFRGSAGATESLEAALPIFLDDDNLKYWFVAVAGSQVVAAVGAHVFGVRAGPFSYQAAHIGVVCTLPKWRGQGIATRLLDFQADLLRSCSVDVGFISGGRELYTRTGATEAGAMCWRRLRANDSSGELIRPLADDDLRALYRLWAMEPISIERTPATWARGLKAVPDRLGWRRAVAVIGHPARAYVVVDADPDREHADLREMAGSRRLAALGACHVAAQLGCKDVNIPVPSWDAWLEEETAAAEPIGAVSSLSPSAGSPIAGATYVLLDPVRMFRRQLSVVRRLDPNLPDLELRRESEGYALRAPGGEVSKGDRAWSCRLLFGVDGRKLSPALPIPLPWWFGVTYG
jgi:GNAT superfamily N-acetyltransferase